MALKSTIYKVDLQVNNFDIDYYQAFSLNVALHPSEKAVRMLTRILVFALNANEDLQFTKGLSTDEEPDIWQKSLAGDIEHWIELGFPEEKRIRQACSRANKVSVYAYQGRKLENWESVIVQSKLDRDKVNLFVVEQETLESIADQLDRTFEIDCMIQDGQVTLTVAGSVASVAVRSM